MSATILHDVIVVGTDLAGIMAAGLLRRANYRVLLVGQGGLRDMYEHEGKQLAALPRILPPRGHARALDEVLDTLAVEDPVHLLGVNPDPHIQVVTPHQRVDLFCDPVALTAELRRSVPDQADAFQAALKELNRANKRLDDLLGNKPPLPADGFFERSRLNKIERNSNLPAQLNEASWPPLMRILAQAASFTSHLGSGTRAASATARSILAMLKGPRIVPDLAERLVQAVSKAGVDVEMSMVAEHLLFDGKSVTGLQTLRSAKTYQCEVLLAGLPLAEASELIPPSKRRQKARMAADILRPEQSVFVVNLILPRSALPLGMSSHVLLVRDPEAAIGEDNVIRLTTQPHAELNDRVQLCAACLVSHRKRSLGREYLGPLQQRMMEAVAWLIPFVEQTQYGCSSPFWSSRTADDSHPAPWTLHRTIETVVPPALGIAVHSIKTPLRNLMLCGPEVLPGLGLEGEALSARRLVGWLTEHKKLKKIL
jgi:phytoene dehydrogenase-like protein